MKAPLRFSILRYLIDRSAPAAAQDVFYALRKQYGLERQFSLPCIEEHLDSLRGVGILQVADVEEQDGKLIIFYSVTDYGRSRGRCLPRLETE